MKMKPNKSVIIVLFLFIKACKSNSTQMLLLISVYRHGQRSPMIDFKTNQHGGEMAEASLLNTSSIGEAFYKKHQSYLAEVKFPNEVMMYISDSTRTIKTALYRSAVMNPDDSFKSLPKAQLKNYSIEHLNAVFDPLMFTGFLICSDKVNKAIVSNRSYNSLLKEIDSILSRLNLTEVYTAYMNSEVLSHYEEGGFFRTLMVLDYFSTQDVNVFSFEEKLISAHLNEIHAYKRLLDSYTNDENIRKVFVNRILSQLMTDIDKAILGTSLKKLAFFSGHDFTLSTILHALGLNRKEYFYSFNDAINMKLIKENEDYFIEVYYNETPIDLTERGCQKKSCSIAAFKRLLSPYYGFSNDQILDYCNNKIESLTKYDQTPRQDL